MMNTAIQRNPQMAARQGYDLIVVGGGVYGAAMSLEAARRGLRPLLLERDDFGGATSWNSLRIVHGGLRYLQSLDLTRFRESVAERRWFLQNFPDLVKPLRCLMPLYGAGFRRPAIFGAALKLNDLLSAKRNDNVGHSSRLAACRTLSAQETAALFPEVDKQGLRGGGLWHDAVMTSSERVVIEILRWACGCGATALNYLEANRLCTRDTRVTGVETIDLLTQETHTFHAPVVVNCAGPWCGLVSAKFDRDIPHLFRPSLAFNMLLDRPALSEAALAVAPRRPGARTYFLVPWKGRIFAGTYHAPFPGRPTHPRPSSRQIDDFINDLNQAVPGFELRASHVMRIYAGLMPTRVAQSPEPSSREVILNHQSHNGPRGLFSVSGVKFTTARHVAQCTLGQIYAESTDLTVRDNTERPEVGRRASLIDALGLLDEAVPQQLQDVAQLVRDEAVVHLDDLLLRRCDWCGTHEQAIQAGRRIASFLPWDSPRAAQEVARLIAVLDGYAPIHAPASAGAF